MFAQTYIGFIYRVAIFPKQLDVLHRFCFVIREGGW